MKPTPIENLEAGGITFYKGSAGGDVIKRAAALSSTKGAVNTAVFFVLVSTLYFSQPAHGLTSINTLQDNHREKGWANLSVANDDQLVRPSKSLRQGAH